MLWFKRKKRNRRSGRTRNVLDVKLRSSQVRAARTRLAGIFLGVSFATLFGLYLAWRVGDWALDRLVYENKSFAIRRVDVQTDGVISPDQLRRWSGVKPGENLLALDLARVRCELELVPMVQSASVERILPGTVRVRVTERVPVAQVNVPRPRAGGGIEIAVFQLDAEGYVLLPLDPRQRAVPLDEADGQLPVVSGINISDLQPGRRLESPQAHAALQLITEFDSSPMAGLVDLRRIDVASPQVLTATTELGSEVTFGLQDFARQLGRWRKIYDQCRALNKAIGTLDLAVTNNTPLILMEASSIPPPAPRSTKTLRLKKKHV
jgi:cell division septal protein FtsQ